MNEYNYDVEEIKEQNNENYTGFSTDGGSPKKPKKHTALKIAASLMAMVCVSAGSIGVYSKINDRFSDTKADLLYSMFRPHQSSLRYLP